MASGSSCFLLLLLFGSGLSANSTPTPKTSAISPPANNTSEKTTDSTPTPKISATPSSPINNTPEKASQTGGWIAAGFVGVIAFNCVSTVLVLLALHCVYLFLDVARQIARETATLSETSVHVGLGPSAKKAIEEYLKDKPEFAKLLTK